MAHLEGRVIVCAMDARRSQVYNALFLACLLYTSGGDPLRELSQPAHRGAGEAMDGVQVAAEDQDVYKRQPLSHCILRL